MKKFGTAAILCGGKSSRMGFDKCKIKIGDKYLVEIIGEQLEEIFDDIILIANDLNKFDDMKYRIVRDIIPNSGPMGGIYSALNYSASNNVFITACDMPVINTDYIKYMMEIISNKNVEGAVSIKSDYIEPLYAFYSKSMIDKFESHIKKESFKLLSVIHESNMHFIQESEVRNFSSDMSIFTNLNYKADLTELQKIIMGVKINNE
ncbi:MAG: molybdopterin-guanine dinucleotide biosynthesis protein [Clostridiales bacterium]|jgi:molybdopterin-guanine dinucleotide biosynthesis protein A|nr:molybdopterin-guanine dinucleotide biosynthesis protein [Clostridiales bacterium]